MTVSAGFSPVAERTTPLYTATLVDEDGAIIPGSTLTTLVLTHYNLATDAILNSRDAQNVLNANNVTVSELGILEWVLQPLDTLIVDDTLCLETHVALFEFTWNSGARVGKHEIRYEVRNYEQVL
jgi:hypothetical protein